MGANPLLGYYTRIKCIAQQRRHYLFCARTGGHPRPGNYSTTRTRWGTFATMPRMDGVSSRSTIWLRRVKPRPLMTSLCLTGVQIFDWKYCSLILAIAFLLAITRAPENSYWSRGELRALPLPCRAGRRLRPCCEAG